MPSRLIIHAPNIHTGGGKSLLVAVLSSLPADQNCLVIADERLSIAGKISGNIHIRRVSPTLWGRFGAERWLAKHVSGEDTVLAFGNLPPLFGLPGRVIVFLQNRYLVDRVDLCHFPLIARMRLTLERYWFASRVSNADEIIVQTRSMRHLLIARAGAGHRVSVFPFVGKVARQADEAAPHEAAGGPSYDFVYVASGEPHKNHRRLIEAWCLLAKEQQYPSLLLTLDKSKYAALCDWIEEKTRCFGLSIDNLDESGNARPCRFYAQAGALIYPSTVESFGLPLVEARDRGLPVLASELDYVRDLLDPAQSFDPESSISIARAVKRHIGVASTRPAIRGAAELVEYLCGRKPAQASGEVENN